MDCKQSTCNPLCDFYHGNCPYEKDIPKHLQKTIDQARGLAHKLTKLLNEVYFEDDSLGEATHGQILDILAQGEE